MKERLVQDKKEIHGGPVGEAGTEELSKAIRFHRKKSGLSQLELSKLAGVGKTAIFDLEKGKQTIQLDTLLKVIRILNIRMSFQSPMMEVFLRSAK